VLISKHAVRRYRQRFGKRTTSAHRVRRHIRNKIKYDTVKAYRSKTGSYNIVTDEFVAIVRGGVVTTVSHLHDNQRSITDGM
jgi:hypothetical protein